MNDNIIDPIEEDTEGHAARFKGLVEEDTEGHGTRSGRSDVPETDEGDDTEGHAIKARG